MPQAHRIRSTLGWRAAAGSLPAVAQAEDPGWSAAMRNLRIATVQMESAPWDKAAPFETASR
jgi:hypothetical protein